MEEVEGSLCPNCGEYIEGSFDPDNCPNLVNIKYRSLYE